MQSIRLLIIQNENKYLDVNGFRYMKFQPNIIMDRKNDEYLKMADLKGDVELLEDIYIVNNQSKDEIKTLFFLMITSE